MDKLEGLSRDDLYGQLIAQTARAENAESILWCVYGVAAVSIIIFCLYVLRKKCTNQSQAQSSAQAQAQYMELESVNVDQPSTRDWRICFLCQSASNEDELHDISKDSKNTEDSEEYRAKTFENALQRIITLKATDLLVVFFGLIFAVFSSFNLRLVACLLRSTFCLSINLRQLECHFALFWAISCTIISSVSWLKSSKPMQTIFSLR